ncbi:hypothetical protein HK098_000229 [Nowakowskiella sp. JEL0407]|nr:hypothetical protein HK098_000229 [Nowakowskiella sp. JEL0407]
MLRWQRTRKTFSPILLDPLIYVVWSTGDQYSLEEGYVIDSFVELFQSEIADRGPLGSVVFLQNILALEGRKSLGKGTPFEAIVLAELVKLNGASVADIISRFGVIANVNVTGYFLVAEKNGRR